MMWSSGWQICVYEGEDVASVSVTFGVRDVVVASEGTTSLDSSCSSVSDVGGGVTSLVGVASADVASHTDHSD